MKRGSLYVLFVAMCAAVFLLPRPAYDRTVGQPDWVEDEAARKRRYPSAEWYTGFGFSAQGGKRAAGSNRIAAEESARKNLVQSIFVSIKVESSMNTASDVKQVNDKINEIAVENYRQNVQSKSAAEVAKMEILAWHNPKTGEAYALAAVRKSDLAPYYASRLDYRMQRAKNAFDEARQLAQFGKKDGALKKCAESKSNLDECTQYLWLLSAVDYESGKSKRLFASETAMRREINALVAETEESMSLYVEGTETAGGAEVDILTSKLKGIISKNGYRLADDQSSAGYSLRVEVNDCNVRPTEYYTFCSACVRMKAVNLTTGKNAGQIDFEGSKKSGDDEKTACVKAFEGAASELWDRMMKDIKIFSK